MRTPLAIIGSSGLHWIHLGFPLPIHINKYVNDNFTDCFYKSLTHKNSREKYEIGDIILSKNTTQALPILVTGNQETAVLK